MRTRLSPRNQNILYRALSGKTIAVDAPKTTERCASCRAFYDTKRNDGTCTERGKRTSRLGCCSLYAPRGTCAWTFGEDGVWTTECGSEWEYAANDSPTANGQFFCHRCGRRIVISQPDAGRKGDKNESL